MAERLAVNEVVGGSIPSPGDSNKENIMNDKNLVIGFAVGLISPMIIIGLFLTYKTVINNETYVIQSPIVLLDQEKQSEIADQVVMNITEGKRK